MSKGFTLIELLTAIGLLSLLLLFSFPTFNAFSARLSLDAAAKTLAADLRNLQSQAVLEHKTQKLNLSKLNLPSGVKIIQASSISFSSSGFPPPGGAGSLILKNRLGQSKKIIVSSAGRVRIE